MVSQLFSPFFLFGEGMANRKVSVWKYVKVGNRWKYCRPVDGRNNRIKPHWVFVNGKPEHHPEGNFYISYRDGKKKIWKKIGPAPSDAVNAAEIEKSILNAKALGVPIKPEVPKLDYNAEMWKFLNDYKLSQSLESHELMRQTQPMAVSICKARLRKSLAGTTAVRSAKAAHRATTCCRNRRTQNWPR
jgi:hypothetical protein